MVGLSALTRLGTSFGGFWIKLFRRKLDAKKAISNRRIPCALYEISSFYYASYSVEYLSFVFRKKILSQICQVQWRDNVFHYLQTTIRKFHFHPADNERIVDILSDLLHFSLVEPIGD